MAKALTTFVKLGQIGVGELIQETLRRHGAYLQAIRDRDGRTAEALARQDLVDYYGPHLEADERARIDLLLMP